MSLRKVTLIVVGLTFLGLVAFLTFALESILLRHFAQVEQQTVYLSAQRAVTAIQGDFETLADTGKSWAAREDITQYLSQPDNGDIDAIFSTTIFTDLNLNVLVLADRDGQVVYGKSFDLDNQREDAMAPELASRIQPNDSLLQTASRPEGLQDVLATEKGPLLLFSLPVGTPELQEPPAGTLIVGRYLTTSEVLRIGSMIQLPMTVLRYDDPALPSDFQRAREVIARGEGYAAIPVNGDQIGAFTLLRDAQDQPAYIIKTEQRRVIYQTGQMMTRYLVAALYAAGFVFGLMTIFLLETLVLARLTRLNHEVNQIGASGDLARRVTLTRKDELSSLSGNINRMLSNLEQSQTKQQELQGALSQRVEELGALYDTSQSFLSQLDKATYLQSACRMAVERFGVDMALISELSRDEAWMVPTAAFPEAQVDDLEKLPVDGTESSRHPTLLACKSNTRVIVNELAPALESKYRSAAAFPLFKDEECLAVLSMYSLQNEFFSPERVQLLQAFANLSGMALHNAHLFKQVLDGQNRMEMLSRRLVEVQEEERKYLAMELHDEIGQVLTGLKLQLDMTSPTDTDRLLHSREMVNELIGSIRQMSLELRPSILDDLGLLPALLWQFENYTSQTAVNVVFQQTSLENRRFSFEVETTAYRVIQEALTNVARHAHTGEVTVRVWNAGEILGIQVEDRGVGFDLERLYQDGKTRGLLGIRERVNFVGGNLNITTSPGEGTCLTMQLPLHGCSEGRKNADINPVSG